MGRPPPRADAWLADSGLHAVGVDQQALSVLTHESGKRGPVVG